jgi:hypothetical protein
MTPGEAPSATRWEGHPRLPDLSLAGADRTARQSPLPRPSLERWILSGRAPKRFRLVVGICPPCSSASQFRLLSVMSPERTIVLKPENLDVSKMCLPVIWESKRALRAEKKRRFGGADRGPLTLAGESPPGELGIAALGDDQCNSREANGGGPGCKPVAQVEKSGCA